VGECRKNPEDHVGRHEESLKNHQEAIQEEVSVDCRQLGEQHPDPLAKYDASSAMTIFVQSPPGRDRSAPEPAVILPIRCEHSPS